MTLLRSLGETIPRITVFIPKVTRDPKDDYLLVYALVGGADFLITGDEDLLVLNKQIQELNIVTARRFVEEVLDQA